MSLSSHAPSSYDHIFGQLCHSLSFTFTPEVVKDSNTFHELLKGSATIVAESGDAFPDLVWSSQADILKDLLPDSACALFPTSARKGKSLDFSAVWAAMVNLLEAGFLAGYVAPTGPNFTIKWSP
jgi:hypothetical protein